MLISSQESSWDMERLARFALYLAIGIGITVFGLFLFSILPHIIENSWRDWERLDEGDASSDEIYAKMTAHPAYLAMYEVYPDAKEEFTYNDKWSARLQVGIMSFETQNKLMLNLDYSDYNGKTDAYVRCNTDEDRPRMDADGLFAEDFIRNVDCLGAAGTADGSKQAVVGSAVAG